MDLISILNSLRTKRPVFCSESDFQFALAWEIQSIYRNADIKLEYCPDPVSNMHIDIMVFIDGKIYPIELKYKTKAFVTTSNGIFYLKNQGAQNIGKYDYLKDIQRIEALSTSIPGFEKGFAIILTNDNSYWTKKDPDCVDSAFYLLPGLTKTGTLNWAKHASAGTKKGRTTPITLSGNYIITWNDYYISTTQNGAFKYCISEIKI